MHSAIKVVPVRGPTPTMCIRSIRCTIRAALRGVRYAKLSEKVETNQPVFRMGLFFGRGSIVLRFFEFACMVAKVQSAVP